MSAKTITRLPKATEAYSQLATRIPQALHRQVRARCVEGDITLGLFVVEALTAALKKKSK